MITMLHLLQKAFYSIYKDKDKQQKLISLKKFIKASQKFSEGFKQYKVSMDNDSGIFRYSATGDIDKSKQTISFKEGLSILNSFPASVGDKLDPVVYNYEIKDGILYLYADGTTTKEGLPAHFEFRFKQVQNKRRNRKEKQRCLKNI